MLPKTYSELSDYLATAVLSDDPFYRQSVREEVHAAGASLCGGFSPEQQREIGLLLGDLLSGTLELFLLRQELLPA
jgi:hypothetical protein